MAFSPEAKLGIDYLRTLIESSGNLQLGQQGFSNQTCRYIFQIQSSENKEWEFSLTENEIHDLPGTPNYHSPAIAFARGLDNRFRNLSPNLFMTRKGNLLRIQPLWHGVVPANETQRLNANGGGIWVDVDDYLSNSFAHCWVITEDNRGSQFDPLDPFSRFSLMINSIRFNFDNNGLRLADSHRDLPETEPVFRIRTEFGKTSADERREFVRQKVFLLGFRAGDQRTAVWITDPVDAEYLGCSVTDLRRQAELLNAKNEIRLDDNHEFACAGKQLLINEGSPPKQGTKKPQFRTAIASYTLRNLLGQGGAGKVYRAIDDDSSEFAIKHLDTETVSTRRSKRFKNEIMFSVQYTSPHIIRIVDFGLVEIKGIEVPFYVMPIYSSTLRKLMQGNAQIPTMLRLFRQVLSGVEFAHTKNIWHRDLKPENILCDADANLAVVSDFGIAHFSEDFLKTSIDTGPEERLANFRYAAPEQRSNKFVDHKADIYALGLILYEVCTGELLQGTGHKRIQSIAPEFAYLDALVDRMVRQVPEERPASVSEVIRDFDSRSC
jgi:hypothetical protein